MHESPIQSSTVRPPFEVPVITTFQAFCDVCLWHGRDRNSNLTALSDYDRHVLTAAHRDGLEAIDAIDSDEETLAHEAELDARHDAYHGIDS